MVISAISAEGVHVRAAYYFAKPSKSTNAAGSPFESSAAGAAQPSRAWKRWLKRRREAPASRFVGRSFSSDINSTRGAAYLSRAPLPRVFELLAADLPRSGPARLPPLGLHLNYRNDCVIISRALISSPPGGYMVHAARASTASAPAPLPTRHFLIGHSAIKNARNSPENNALHFSNRLKTANCSARFSRVLRPQNHDSPVAGHESRIHHSPITTHQSRISNR